MISQPNTELRPGDRYVFERAPWCSPWLWLGLGAGMLPLDAITGPYGQFPVLFILPVLLVAWHRGTRWAAVYAVVLCSVRFCIHLFRETSWGVLAEGRSGVMPAVVLGLFAALTARMAGQTRELRRRTGLRETFVWVCSHCKSMRDEKGGWMPMEAYLAPRTGVTFSHGVCSQCMKLHYGDLMDEEPGD